MPRKPVCIIILLLAIIVSACPYWDNYKYDEGIFPTTPVNMEDANSIYDDYNSSSPYLGGTSQLWFSTNRNSTGENFDIIARKLDVNFNRSSGILTIETSEINNQALSIINTGYDEIGPYSVPNENSFGNRGTGQEMSDGNYFFYATNGTGNFDIMGMLVFYKEINRTPRPIFTLNSGKDDAYPTLNSDHSAIYFCSNRDLTYDIFKAEIPENNDLFNILWDTIPFIFKKDTVLSSDFDDKCPFIEGNLMVFTSNRPGGYGGYDLYYSFFENKRWSSPENFGEIVNTQYDEFRPIIKTYMHDFKNDLMIFSSNLPEGKGGFDLYYVGIEKMTGHYSK